MSMEDKDLDKVDSTVLESDDLPDVLEEVSSISKKADKLGTALGLSAGSFDPNMESVILKWLEQDYNTGRRGLPSYRTLVKAVASKIGGRNPALAKKIAAKHPAGGVPQEPQTQGLNKKKTQGPIETQAQFDDQSVAKARAIDDDGIGDIWRRIFSEKIPTEFEPYPMTKCPHGLCLIINNVEFDDHPKRTGAYEDEKELEKVFTGLEYKLYKDKVHRNCTKDEMMALLKEVADFDHSNYDSFICCLGSHGKQGVIYGTDNGEIQVEEIEKLFTIKCKTLIGKPKMFFIQACRGKGLPEERIQDDGDEDEKPIRLPQDSDVFVGYATTPYTRACHFKDTGSWYFIELCKALQDHSKDSDLLSLVTAVHLKIATNKEYFKQKHNEEIVNYRQCPQLVSTLLRPVKFKIKK